MIRLIIEVLNEDDITLDKWQKICRTDGESLDYLQELEDNKMQIIFKRLGWGQYDRSKIIVNHGSSHNHGSPQKIKCERNALYHEAVKNNLIHTTVKITHV